VNCEEHEMDATTATATNRMIVVLFATLSVL